MTNSIDSEVNLKMDPFYKFRVQLLATKCFFCSDVTRVSFFL